MTGDTVMMRSELAFPMVPEMEIEASRTAMQFAESMRMSPDKIDEIRMAVVEVCINALEYSRASDQTVYVTFEALGDRDPEKLRITVRDTGVGFSPEDVVKPVIQEKLKSSRKRGWGLEIIRGLMDEVEIHSGSEGTTVVMSKMR